MKNTDFHSMEQQKFDLKAPENLKRATLAQMQQAAGKKKDRFYPVAAALLTAAACLALVWIALPREDSPNPSAPSSHSGQTEPLTAQTNQSALAHLTSSLADSQSVLKRLRDADSLVPYYDKPREDNTPPELVAEIREGRTLQWPLTDYRISLPYNDYAENGVPLHPRTDMAAPKGTNVFPLCEGVVTETGYVSSWGNYITIDHGDGLTSSYAHCQEIFFRAGDSVSMGDVIATVGATGMATGPFLAFSVTQDDVPINPEALFQ